MCGIFGYLGDRNQLEVCLKGLKLLEYRGYDSAGFAALAINGMIFTKEIGNISKLEKKIPSYDLKLNSIIAHTRWATHGKPSEYNAHPHFDKKLQLAVVHNGIIENYLEIKKKYFPNNEIFYSDTDTEVIAKLISHFYKDDILDALKKTFHILKGSFAIAIIHCDYPEQIFAICNNSPLCIGKAEYESFISSDVNAFSDNDLDVTYLQDNQICHLKRDKIIIYNANLKELPLKLEKFKISNLNYSKNNFEHFMLKEIHEQPDTLQRAIENRYLLDYGTANFNLKIPDEVLSATKHIIIVGCGTSYHAALIGANYLEELSRITTKAEIASELRYKNPIISEDTLVIAISQSGETADTIAAIKEAKIKGAKILSICNRLNSTLVRESNGCIPLNAGPEISVCSTKAFTSQVAVLYLFSIYMARLRHMNKQQGQNYLKELIKLPSQITNILSSKDQIQQISIKYSQFQDYIFIGRRYMFPSALEAALKLKEISYLNATGYPAGELKHGPIALLDHNLPVIGLCANSYTLDKIHANLMESKARSAPIIAIAFQSSKKIAQIADDIIYLPDCIDELAVLTTSIACQLFAYYIAKELGSEIDQPRNLAKSVTVE
jgi:glutamine---fructose-6-phosphate transaminase (isomerizing)